MGKITTEAHLITKLSAIPGLREACEQFEKESEVVNEHAKELIKMLEESKSVLKKMAEKKNELHDNLWKTIDNMLIQNNLATVETVDKMKMTFSIKNDELVCYGEREEKEEEYELDLANLAEKIRAKVEAQEATKH